MGVDASLEESLEAVAAGDAAGPELAEVFDAHAPYVGRTLRLLGVRERELGDALQEVFLVVHRRLGELEEPSKLRAWLYAICVRKAMSLRRDAARRREDSVAEPPELEVERRTPHDDLEKARALAAAFEILEALDEDKRAIFVLYEVEQQPMSEIAEALGCPLQTAYARLYAARREVSRALARLKAKGKVER